MNNEESLATEKARKVSQMFDQLEQIEDKEDQQKAITALNLLHEAKNLSALGLGPMEARHEYKEAYQILSELGVEVGGLTKPYNSPNDSEC